MLLPVMLCRMAFCLAGEVVDLHLFNSTAKAYLCNQGGTVSPFLFRLACQILSLTNKHGITLLPAYIPTQLNVEADYVPQDWLLPAVAPSPSGDSDSFSPLGLSRGGSAGFFSFYSMPALFHFGNSTTSGGLGVECLQPSLDLSGKLCVSSSSSGPSCSVKVSSRTCQQSTQTFEFLVAPCWMEAPWLPTIPNMLADVPHWQCPIIKDLIMDVSVGPCSSRVCDICILTLWQLQQCVLHQQEFSSLVFQVVVGATQMSTSRV